MRNKKLKIALILCTVLLAAELSFLGVMHFRENSQEQTLSDLPGDTSSDTLPQETSPQTQPSEETEATTLPSEATEPTEEVTEPTETEPEQTSYILTFVGDCTLASSQDKYNATGGFIQTIGEDYDYPFRNVVQFFENDDFTMVNLESVLADSGTAAAKTFSFRGPTAYTQILTGSSVEAVTLANNHTEDYGKDGYASTKSALEEAGVAYVEKDNTMLFTTESGLTIGIYAASFTIDTKDMTASIAELREQGAEIVVCAFHWGNEGQYRPTSTQQNDGYAAIDAGADIVYGSHPHVLQKIEEYNGGIIYYSLGNFSFGGNHFPRDMDSVIVRQEVIRQEDGTVALGQLTLIPVSISSMTGQNNFQPTPYEEGSKEYERTLTKLDGTFTGADLIVDYSFLDPTEETTAPAEGDDASTPAEGGDVSGDTSGDTSSDAPAGDAGADPGADSGSDTPASGDSGVTEG